MPDPTPPIDPSGTPPRRRSWLGVVAVGLITVAVVVALVAVAADRTPPEAAALFDDPALHVEIEDCPVVRRSEDDGTGLIEIAGEQRPSVLVVCQADSPQAADRALARLRDEARAAGWSITTDRPGYWAASKSVDGAPAFLDAARGDGDQVTLSAGL